MTLSELKPDQRWMRFEAKSSANEFEIVRFNGPKMIFSVQVDSWNKQLHELRQKRRKELESQGFFGTADGKTALKAARTLVGTCLDMCPEYERHERELHLDLSPFEMVGINEQQHFDFESLLR